VKRTPRTCLALVWGLGLLTAWPVPASAQPAPACFAAAGSPVRQGDQVVAAHTVVCTEKMDTIIVVGSLTRDGSQKDATSKVCHLVERCGTTTSATYDGRGTWHGFTGGSAPAAPLRRRTSPRAGLARTGLQRGSPAVGRRGGRRCRSC